MKQLATRNGGDDGDRLVGTTDADALFGNGGDDTVFGGKGADRLFGGVGDDTLYGGAGNDFFDDGPDNDVMYGGDGVDSLFRNYTGAPGFTLSINFVTGLISAPEFPGDPDYFFEIENYGFKGSLNSIMTGNAANNRIETDLGNDTLYGGAGADVLISGSGRDSVFGGSGGDKIVGGNGSDHLHGGTANDTMSGNGGADFFVFDTSLGARNSDVISDYNASADTLLLDGSVFLGLGTGQIARSAFAANAMGLARDSNDRIVFETDTGRVFYDGDGTGAGRKVLFATVSSGIAMTYQDFVVI
jgi:serralysin